MPPSSVEARVLPVARSTQPLALGVIPAIAEPSGEKTGRRSGSATGTELRGRLCPARGDGRRE
jgi:hypothetical protein